MISLLVQIYCEELDYYEEKKFQIPSNRFFNLASVRMTTPRSTFDIPRQAPLKGRFKLTAEQVIDGRLRYSQGRVSQRQLASELGVSVLTVANFIHGRSWKHVGESQIKQSFSRGDQSPSSSRPYAKRVRSPRFGNPEPPHCN